MQLENRHVRGFAGHEADPRVRFQRLRKQVDTGGDVVVLDVDQRNVLRANPGRRRKQEERNGEAFHTVCREYCSHIASAARSAAGAPVCSFPSIAASSSTMRRRAGSC